MGNISQDIIPHHINLSAVTAEDYHLVYDIIQKVKEEEFSALHLNSCQIEDELNKVSRLFKHYSHYHAGNIHIIQDFFLGKWPLKCRWKIMMFQNSHFLFQRMYFLKKFLF